MTMIDRLRRQAAQGESISREDAIKLLSQLSYTDKLLLREYLRAMKKAPCSEQRA